MRYALPLVAVAAIVAVPVIAQQSGPPGAPDKSRVAAGTYAADPGHTLVVWEVDHFGFSRYSGIFGDVTGTLILDPANPAASKVEVTIPVAKVTTASAGLTGHLLRDGKDGGKPDFFGSAPADAKFVSTSVVVDEDGDEAKVTGNLTLNGVTRPVTLDVDFHGAWRQSLQQEGDRRLQRRSDDQAQRFRHRLRHPRGQRRGRTRNPRGVRKAVIPLVIARTPDLIGVYIVETSSGVFPGESRGPDGPAPRRVDPGFRRGAVPCRKGITTDLIRGTRQSRAVYSCSGLLRSARNDDGLRFIPRPSHRA